MNEDDWALLAMRHVTVVELTGADFREALDRTRHRITEDEQPLLFAERGWFVEHPRYIRPIDGPYPTREAALVGAVTVLVRYIDFQWEYGLFGPSAMRTARWSREEKQPNIGEGTAHRSAAVRGVFVVELDGLAFHEAMERTGNTITEKNQPLIDMGRGWFVEHPRYLSGGDGPYATYEAALVGAISCLVSYINYHDRFHDPFAVPEQHQSLKEILAEQRAARQALEAALNRRFPGKE